MNKFVVTKISTRTETFFVDAVDHLDAINRVKYKTGEYALLPNMEIAALNVTTPNDSSRVYDKIIAHKIY